MRSEARRRAGRGRGSRRGWSRALLLVSRPGSRARGLFRHVRRRSHVPRHAELRLQFAFGEARGTHVGASRRCGGTENRPVTVADDFVAGSLCRSNVGRVSLRSPGCRRLRRTPRDQHCHDHNEQPHATAPKIARRRSLCAPDK